MQHYVDIPFSVLYNQTCVHCHLPVTCAPVYVINDLRIICGRCQHLAKDHYRNLPYEAVAKIYLYPCKNWKNHCSVKLEWNESLKHEEECNYVGCCSLMCCHPGAFFQGTRDIPTGDFQWVSVPDHLLTYLECVLCRGYLNSEPVFLQSDGQNICHRCVNANGNPPNCRRNKSYEEFSENLLFSCTYKRHGCPDRLPFGIDIWKHESQCEYNPHHEKHKRVSHVVQDNDQDQRPNGKPRKVKGVITTPAGTHIWATITPQQVTKAQQEKVISSLKDGKLRRRADELDYDRNDRRNSESESISTNESYVVKGSGHSTPSEYLDPRRQYNDASRSPSEYTRSDSRESDLQPPRYKDPTEYNQQPIKRPPSSEEYYDPPPVGRGQYPGQPPYQLAEPSYDPTRRTSHRESLKRESALGNPMLINELKIRQDLIKRTHSIKGGMDGNGRPYRPNSNQGNIGGISENRRQW